MKFIINTIFLFTFLMMLMMIGCDDNNDIADNGDDFTGESQTYELHESADSGISGFVVFEEMTDGSTFITIDLNGTESGVEYPAHIHANTVAEGGGVDIPLTNVDGDNGMSETEVSSLNGTPITYQDLIAYDGHVNVHNPDDTSIIFAEGDIGGNALTGESITYELQEASDSGISGEVRFEERNNGNTLSTIEVTGTVDGAEYAAHIHNNSVAEGGGVEIPFNNVDGSTGVSVTNIRAEMTDNNITYTDLLEFDGHVNVHDPDDPSILVAQGDIGGNALTGESITYELQEASDSGISGEVRFEERNNGNTLSTIELTGTADGLEYEAHIHYNSVADGGGIAFPFNNVDGTTGVSVTNIRAEQTDDNLSYSTLLEFDGHVNVHDPDDLSILVAQGNIGANEGEDPGNGNDNIENGNDNGNGEDDNGGNDNGNNGENY